MKHGVSIVCTYTLYVNTTYSSEDTVRENQCIIEALDLRWLWTKASRGTMAALEISMDQQKQYVDDVSRCPNMEPLSNLETWPIPMGSLVGCKAQAPLLLLSSVLHGCVLRFFVCPQFPTTCMYTSCVCPCIVTLLDLKIDPPNRSSPNGDTPSIAQNKLGQFGTPSNHC